MWLEMIYKTVAELVAENENNTVKQQKVTWGEIMKSQGRHASTSQSVDCGLWKKCKDLRQDLTDFENSLKDYINKVHKQKYDMVLLFKPKLLAYIKSLFLEWEKVASIELELAQTVALLQQQQELPIFSGVGYWLHEARETLADRCDNAWPQQNLSFSKSDVEVLAEEMMHKDLENKRLQKKTLADKCLSLQRKRAESLSNYATILESAKLKITTKTYTELLMQADHIIKCESVEDKLKILLTEAELNQYTEELSVLLKNKFSKNVIAPQHIQL